MYGESMRVVHLSLFHLLIAFVLVLISISSQAGADDDFCEIGTKEGPVDGEKIFGKSFTADIYSIDIREGKGIRAHEHYSSREKVSAVFLNLADEHGSTQFHIYNRDKKTGVSNIGGGACKTDNSEPSFGLLSLAVVEIVQKFDSYVGTEEVSGETLHCWRICYSNDDFEYREDLYTTGETDQWQNPPDNDYVPVKIVQYKKNKKTKEESRINHYVLSFESRDDDSDEFKGDLSPPIGSTCDAYETRDLPELPKSIYYSTEFTTTPERPVTYMIDSDRQLIIKESQLKDRNVQQTDVDSYKLGVMFQVPGEQDERCLLTPYAVLGDKDLDVSLSYADAYLSTPFETVQHFIGNSEGFTFNGEHEVRGIPCEVYTKFYSDYRGNGETTVVLYFSKSNLNIYSSVAGESPSGAVLLKKDIWKDGKLKYEENIYNVGSLDYSRLDYDPLDMSECQATMGAIEFTLVFEAKGSSAARMSYGDRDDLRSALTSKLAKTASVDELRVHVVDLLVQDERLIVQARLLGPPSGSSNIREVNVSVVEGSQMASDYKIDRLNYGYESCQVRGNQKEEAVFGSFCSDTYSCALYKDINMNDLEEVEGCKGFFIGRNKIDPVTLDNAWDALSEEIKFGSFEVEGYKASLVSKFDPDSVNDLDIPNIQKYHKIPGSRINREVKTSNHVSLVSCTDSCTASLGYQCEAFSYCEKSQLCVLNPNVDKGTDVSIEPDENCDVYLRTYLSEFTAVAATSTAIDTEMVFEMVSNPNLCARFCLDLDDFRCESFDFCSLDGQGASGTCSLFRKHYFDMAQSTEPLTLPDTECHHYARNYLGDYDRKDGLTELPIRTKVRKASPESCARSCSTKDTSGEGHCTMFQFCTIGSVCEFIDESSIKSDASRHLPELKEASGCATYSLKNNVYQIHGRSEALRDEATQALTSALNGGTGGGKEGGTYGPGAMAAVSLVMLLLGAGLVVLALFLWARYSRLGSQQEMAMQFTKTRFDDE